MSLLGNNVVVDDHDDDGSGIEIYQCSTSKVTHQKASSLINTPQHKATTYFLKISSFLYIFLIFSTKRIFPVDEIFKSKANLACIFLKSYLNICFIKCFCLCFASATLNTLCDDDNDYTALANIIIIIISCFCLSSFTQTHIYTQCTRLRYKHKMSIRCFPIRQEDTKVNALLLSIPDCSGGFRLMYDSQRKP